MTVREAAIAALVDALNTGRPAGVPIIERDRWIDVESGPTGSVVALTGWEDEALEGQLEDRVVDQRRAKLVFEIYGFDGATPARTIVDDTIAWIGTKCGPVDAGSGSLATAGVIRVLLPKLTAIVWKGGAWRCAADVWLYYRNLTNDLTRAR